MCEKDTPVTVGTRTRIALIQKKQADGRAFASAKTQRQEFPRSAEETLIIMLCKLDIFSVTHSSAVECLTGSREKLEETEKRTTQHFLCVLLALLN